MVTGGMGFIGSNLVHALNELGVTDILVVDELNADSLRRANCRGCEVLDTVDKEDFMRTLERGRLGHEIAVVYHQGACTDTLNNDEAFMMERNFEFSKRLLDWVSERSIPMVYASSAAVYGVSATFTEEVENEAPLNAYGRSKLAFDEYARLRMRTGNAALVGLRYFNVYGPREVHKGKMMSMVGQMYWQLVADGSIGLFEGTGGFGAGEQRRDFVYVEDVVKANVHFGTGPVRRGIFNVGTGRGRSFGDIARIWIDLMGTGRVRHIPVPIEIRDRYQSFTEADLTALRKAGYESRFTSVERGISKYYEWLESERKLEREAAEHAEA